MLDHALTPSQNIYTIVDTGAAYTANFPYVEVVNFKGGPSAVIRGTRFNVCHIIGYLLMGETPETLAQEFPLTVAQIHDAQRYYAYHKDEIDEERRENTEAAGKKKLLELLGEENYRKVTGG